MRKLNINESNERLRILKITFIIENILNLLGIYLNKTIPKHLGMVLFMLWLLEVYLSNLIWKVQKFNLPLRLNPLFLLLVADEKNQEN